MNQTDLFPETLLVSRDGDGRIYTDSLRVAEHFHKHHRIVTRDIEKLLASLAEPESHCTKLCSEIDPTDDLPGAFLDLFEPFIYTNRRGRSYRAWRITHDGFALLAMGFTGREALRWKLDFLAAFRQIEHELAAFKEREANALYALRPRWQPIILHPAYSRAALIALTGHTSPASISACRRRMREVGLLERRAS
jgi:phage regulator Rha-like protein